MTNPQHLADALEAEGVLPPQWANTVRAVDRGLFIPGKTRELDRHSAPQAWLDAVYADAPVVTQWDDGRPDGHGFPTSSSSKPSVMLETLALADVRPGDRVYELGTERTGCSPTTRSRGRPSSTLTDVTSSRPSSMGLVACGTKSPQL
jgi:protein-L-isoaspartate O-methyltransferase